MKLLGIARPLLLTTLTVLVCAGPARGAETLCDPSDTNCRTQLLSLIANEKQGIDVAFWFMQDTRYSNAIIQRWQAGIPVRVLIDTRANASYAGNADIIAALANAGIPLRRRTASGILHWKMMLFAGQNTVEFGSANFSPSAFVYDSAYTNYVAETVYYSDDASVVNSFKTEFDNAWADTTSFANYANVTSLARRYPTFAIDPELNFPPYQDYAKRAVALYNKEASKIDAIMFRITDRRHTDAIIGARSRGIPVRMIVDNAQYRSAQYLWDAWNVDRLYMAGVKLRWRGHAGENHEKLVLLYGQQTTIFGSSNWTSASAASQLEHNYFTTKSWIFQWFTDQFNRMWGNTAGATETVAFTPLPPDRPTYKGPTDGGSVSTSTATLKWYGGPWAHNYDIYFGTSSPPPLLASNVNLGPSSTSTTYQQYTTPSLAPGTTYYWQIVSKTMANVAASGPVWYFTTSGSVASSLPSGWNDADIGSVGVRGAASYSNGTFSVAGSGADIWGSADAFNYAYQTLSGDGQIIARVASVQNVASWSKAGVMIRGSLASNAAYALMLVSAGKGTAFQYRTASGASAANITGPGAAAPYWVKVVRSGSTITGYTSSNGTSWTKAGSASLSIGSTAYIGLAVSSHDNSRLCTATFDHVAR